MGQLLGRYGRYLSAAEVRRILGRPGTTIYRLLTDPADGRCVERSLTAYSPDAAMRAQLHAADVTSRAPGSTTPAVDCQLDHVLEYLLAGPTSEPNLQTLDVPFHALKTEKFWDAEMDASRNVTWTSFWGRIYRTRPYDYRQFFTWVLGPEGDGSDPGGQSPGGKDPADDQLVDERYLASLLVYAALARRGPGGRLEADDDDPDDNTDSDASIERLRRALVLRHTSSNGRKVPGPRPGTPTPEDLLATDRQDVLDSGDWVDTVADSAAHSAEGADDQEGVSADRDGASDRDDAAEDDRPAHDPPPF